MCLCEVDNNRRRIIVNIYFVDEAQIIWLTLFCGCAFMAYMKTIETIFNELGGPAKVAGLLGVKESTAGEMKRRKAIRVCYWPTLVRVCREKRIKGVNYNMLVELHQERASQ
jgi:hypothetical protein